MYTVSIHEAFLKNRRAVGGKAGFLGELLRAGFPVPAGFVIRSNAFDMFLKNSGVRFEIGRILAEVNYHRLEELEESSIQIQMLFENSDIHPDILGEIEDGFTALKARYVAIRSSASMEDSTSSSWAGQLETYLNIRKLDLAERIKQCWASLYKPEAILYRHERKLSDRGLSMAVIVQRMIQPEVSGVAFSMNPVTVDYDQVIIEAGYGLGLAVVSGEIIPDTYVVQKTPLLLIKKTIHEQRRLLERNRKSSNTWISTPEGNRNRAKLSDQEITHLTDTLIRIENHFGFPVDIEWVKKGKGFHIVQCRPVTGLSRDTSKQSISPQEEIKAHNVNIKNIAIEHYDFLWTSGFHYLYGSISYESGYSKRDFIVFTDTKECTRSIFVSRAERKRLSRIGLRLYTSGFKKYEARVKAHLERVKKSISQERHKNVKAFTNRQLATEFKRLVGLCIKMWSNYFPTEYHSSDLVLKALTDSRGRYNLDQLRANITKMAKLKMLQRKYINKLLYPPSILDRFIEEINNRLDLKYPITTYGFKELIDLLVGKKVRVLDRSGYVLTGSLFRKEIIGEKAKEIYNQLLDVKADCNYILGSVAHPGHYKGRVKKIDFSIRTDYIREIASMQKGDVLVSGSTGPEMILACKKAGAIVTDEGGIISHAALISRELAIPCVIGTNIATRILKDGDLVDVDANNGIIQIVSRK